MASSTWAALRIGPNRKQYLGCLDLIQDGAKWQAGVYDSRALNGVS